METGCVNYVKTFGFLAITIGKYSSKSFYTLTNVNIGIFKIEGISEIECKKHFSANGCDVLQINNQLVTPPFQDSLVHKEFVPKR